MAQTNPWQGGFQLPLHTPVSGVLSDIIAIGRQAGIQQTPAQPEKASGLIDRFLADLQTAHINQVQAADAAAEQTAAELIDADRMQAKVTALEAASVALRSVTMNKETIVQRLQQPCLGPSLLVENEYQAAFCSLLQQAAEGRSRSTQNRLQLQWAEHFAAPQTCWSSAVVPLSDCASILSRSFEEMKSVRLALGGTDCQ